MVPTPSSCPCIFTHPFHPDQHSSHRSETALNHLEAGPWLICIPGMPTNGLSVASTCFQRLIFQLELARVLKTPYSMRASVTGEGGGRLCLDGSKVCVCFLRGLVLTDPSQPGRVQAGNFAGRGWELLEVSQRNRLQAGRRKGTLTMCGGQACRRVCGT